MYPYRRRPVVVGLPQEELDHDIKEALYKSQLGPFKGEGTKLGEVTEAWIETTEPGKTCRAFLAMPSRRCPRIFLGLTLGLFFFLAVFTFKSAMMVVPDPTSSSSRPSTTTLLSSHLLTLLFRSPFYSPAAPHQENILSSTSVHNSPPHPCMPCSKQSVSSSVDQSSQASPPSVDLKSSLKHHSNAMGAHVYKVFSSSPNSTDVKSPSAYSMDHGYHGVYSSQLTVSDLKSSLADSMGHSQDGFSSSSSHDSTNSHCDIAIGRWVEDDTYPLYNPGSCPFVDKKFNCQQNGRPDAKYTRWRWAPRDCNVPRFSGIDMLERLRGKRLVFVGDSLNRNQWESMLCMLRESLADKSKIVRLRGSGRILKFLDYDCSVEFYKSRYLVDMQEGSNQINYTIRLDTMDKSERRWRKANVLIFNTAHWWGPGKIGKGENCFQEGNKVYSKLEVIVAYSKALSTWAKWVDTYVNPQNTSVFFRSYSPVHYRGGQWNSGGQCQDETQPIHEDSYLRAYPDEMQALEGVLKEMRVPVHVLNITTLSDYRKDAHPAMYWHPQHQVVPHQDCGHWCLPGLPDTWNELLYFALTKQTFPSPLKHSDESLDNHHSLPA